jgi:hypothetical protein
MLNLIEVDCLFRGTYYLHHQGEVFIALMMEAIHTSEMSLTTAVQLRSAIGGLERD